jgi:hypothetical protein
LNRRGRKWQETEEDSMRDNQIKEDGMAEHAARMINTYKGRDHWKDLGVHRKILEYRMDLGEIGWGCGLNSSGSG